MEQLIPTQVEKLNANEMFLAWNKGDRFAVPFVEIRFHCPCAHCVDEMTGQRTLKRDSLPGNIHPTKVELIGRYALKITWSDHHNTGMYPFEKLYELCIKTGKKLDA